MPQGAGFSGDRGGQIKRGPRRSLRRGKEPCSSRKPSSFWTGTGDGRAGDLLLPLASPYTGEPSPAGTEGREFAPSPLAKRRRRSGDKGAAGEARFFRSNARDQARACYLPGRRGWQALLPTPQPPHWPHRQPQPPALRRFFMERRASAAHRARSPRITAVPMALRADRPAGTRHRRRARPRRTAAGRRLPPSSRNPAPAAPPQWPRCRAYRAA